MLFLKTKASCVLTAYLRDVVCSLAGYIPIQDQSTESKQAFKNFLKEEQRLELLYEPQSYAEFKSSKQYALPSQIKKYQGFVPWAKPTQMVHNGEQVYLREHLSELHTRDRWCKLRR